MKFCFHLQCKSEKLRTSVSFGRFWSEVLILEFTSSLPHARKYVDVFLYLISVNLHFAAGKCKDFQHLFSVVYFSSRCKMIIITFEVSIAINMPAHHRGR
jgi:hypothetical protein